MDPGVLTALIGSGGLLIGGVVATVVKRGSDKESAQLTSSDSLIDALQAQGVSDRAVSASARAEADQARALLAQESEKFRAQVDQFWAQIAALQKRMDEMRAQHRADLEADDAYILVLIQHINEQRRPPAPTRPPRTSL